MTPTDKQAAVEAALAKWDNRVIELIDINGRQWTRSDRVFDLIDEIRAILAEPRSEPAPRGLPEQCPVCEKGELYVREYSNCSNCDSHIVLPDQSRRNKTRFLAAITHADEGKKG